MAEQFIEYQREHSFGRIYSLTRAPWYVLQKHTPVRDAFRHTEIALHWIWK